MSESTSTTAGQNSQARRSTSPSEIIAKSKLTIDESRRSPPPEVLDLSSPGTGLTAVKSVVVTGMLRDLDDAGILNGVGLSVVPTDQKTNPYGKVFEAGILRATSAAKEAGGPAIEAPQKTDIENPFKNTFIIGSHRGKASETPGSITTEQSMRKDDKMLITDESILTQSVEAFTEKHAGRKGVQELRTAMAAHSTHQTIIAPQSINTVSEDLLRTIHRLPGAALVPQNRGPIFIATNSPPIAGMPIQFATIAQPSTSAAATPVQLYSIPFAGQKLTPGFGISIENGQAIIQNGEHRIQQTPNMLPAGLTLLNGAPPLGPLSPLQLPQVVLPANTSASSGYSSASSSSKRKYPDEDLTEASDLHHDMSDDDSTSVTGSDRSKTLEKDTPRSAPRKTRPIQETDDPELADKRARNRVAAEKCRKRRKAQQQTTLQEMTSLKDKVKQLQKDIQKLETDKRLQAQEIVFLRGYLSAFRVPVDNIVSSLPQTK